MNANKMIPIMANTTISAYLNEGWVGWQHEKVTGIYVEKIEKK